MVTIKVTIVSDKGRRPVSTLINVNSMKDWNDNAKRYKNAAVRNICAKKYWDARDLKLWGYTKVKAEIYTPKTEEEKKAAYDEICRQKFASGEWKPTAAQKIRLGIE